MLTEAQSAGLVVDAKRLERVRGRTPKPPNPWAEPQHESLKGPLWHIAEFVPKLTYNPLTERRGLSIGAGRGRIVHDGAQLHRSILERLRAGQYAPPNLSHESIDSVKALASIPDSLAYDSMKATSGDMKSTSADKK
jgi:hypothetical protein